MSGTACTGQQESKQKDIQFQEKIKIEFICTITNQNNLNLGCKGNFDQLESQTSKFSEISAQMKEPVLGNPKNLNPAFQTRCNLFR